MPAHKFHSEVQDNNELKSLVFVENVNYNLVSLKTSLVFLENANLEMTQNLISLVLFYQSDQNGMRKLIGTPESTCFCYWQSRKKMNGLYDFSKISDLEKGK